MRGLGSYVRGYAEGGKPLLPAYTPSVLYPYAGDYYSYGFGPEHLWFQPAAPLEEPAPAAPTAPAAPAMQPFSLPPSPVSGGGADPMGSAAGGDIAEIEAAVSRNYGPPPDMKTQMAAVGMDPKNWADTAIATMFSALGAPPQTQYSDPALPFKSFGGLAGRGVMKGVELVQDALRSGWGGVGDWWSSMFGPADDAAMPMTVDGSYVSPAGADPGYFAATGYVPPTGADPGYFSADGGADAWGGNISDWGGVGEEPGGGWFASGGPVTRMGLAHYAAGGQADDIPAMLSEDEHVIPTDVVAGLGDGVPDAGHAKLARMIEAVRAHKTSRGAEMPPAAKGLGAYMREPARAKAG